MILHLNLANIPLFLLTLLSLLLAVFTWNRRHILGAAPLTMLLLCFAIFMFGSAMQGGIETEQAILFWHKVEIMGELFLPLAWLLFVMQYSGMYSRTPRILRWAIGVPQIILAVLLWSNDFHNLYWHVLPINSHPENLSALQNHGPAQWVESILGHLYFIISVIILVSPIFRKQKIFPSVALLSCALPPIIFEFLKTMGTPGIPYALLTPLIYTMSGILFTLILFRFRLINIMPIAYETLVGNMNDGVIVLDTTSTITHLNPAAELVLGCSAKNIVGKPVTEALAKNPALLEKVIKNRPNGTDQITFSFPGSTHFYELSISPIQEQSKMVLGEIILLRNITNRVQAEASSRQSQALLHQSEQTYQQLIENIHEVVFVMNTGGEITYISPVIERYTGYTPGEIFGKRVEELVHPDDSASIITTIQKALAGEDVSNSFRIQHKAGNYRIVQSNYNLLYREGHLVGLQGMLMDITDHQQAQEVLERYASQLVMLNNIGEKIAAVMEISHILNSATHLIWSNFGYYHVALFMPDANQHELVMRSAAGAFASLFPPNHRLNFGQGIVGWVAENHTMLLASNVENESRYVNFYPEKILSRSELAVPIMLYDEMVGVLDIQSPMLDSFSENDVRVMKTVADQIAIAIGNARLYEQVRLQLKERERKENILRIQRDLVMALSSHTVLDKMLQTAIETLALELNVPLGAIFLLDSTEEFLHTAASLGYPEVTMRKPIPLNCGVVGWVARNGQPALIGDVSEVPYHIELSPAARSEISAPLISNSKVLGVISLESEQNHAFSQDDLRLLTILANNLVVLIERARLFNEVERARSELEERALALQAANERLRELDRLKSQFLANMSHELRTPLNSIIGFSEVLLDELTGPLNENQCEYIHDIYDSGKHLLALINDLLDFSKIESGQVELDFSTFAIKDVFEEVRAIITPLAEKKGQTLSFTLQSHLPTLTADRRRLKQVFFNLLSNANKFTPQNGKIYISCKRENPDCVLFAFKDNGIGIRREDQDKIFEEFWQVDGTLTREVAGTGLGLAISKQIIELHGGKIWVESRFGKGSTFYIRLPIKRLFGNERVRSPEAPSSPLDYEHGKPQRPD